MKYIKLLLIIYVKILFIFGNLIGCERVIKLILLLKMNLLI